MSNPNWMEKAGATPRKLALVAVLAVVLVVVIVNRLQSSTAPCQPINTKSQTAQAKPRQQKSNTIPKAEMKAAEKLNTSIDQSTPRPTKRTWPALTMDSILSYDPLAEPDWLVKARNAAPPVDKASRLAAEAARQQRKEEILRQLREQGAQAIVFSGSEKRAVIGKQSVRVGETIEGLKITDITRQGIVLTEHE